MSRKPLKKVMEAAIEICSEAVACPTMDSEDTAKYASAVSDMTVSYLLLFESERVQNDPNAWPQAPEEPAGGEDLR